MASLLLRRSSPTLSKPALQSMAIRRSSTLPAAIKPSQDEIVSGRLGSRNLEIAVRSNHLDGLVVVENVIPHNDLDHLNTKMTADARILQARGKESPFNYNVGNLQQDPPPMKEYFSETIFLNSFATQVTTGVLGPKPRWTFCSGNSAMPPLPGGNPQRQPVHTDSDFAHPAHPFALVVNVPLIDFTPENGSTEVWLGTHTGELSGLEVQDGAHGERASGRIKQHLLEKRRAVRGPSQAVVPKGSIVIRDLRLWHAGMPNWTQDIRVMLAMIHFAPWYRNPMRLDFGHSIKPMLESQDSLEIPVDWVGDHEASNQYLNRGFGNSYDFGQTP